MNNEVIKAMNKKETKIDKIRKWWSNNGYKVMRVILFPIWWGIKAKEKMVRFSNRTIHNRSSFGFLRRSEPETQLPLSWS